MVIVIASGTPLPERRREFADAARRMAAATRADPGCVSYGFFSSLDDEAVVSVEVWTDRASLEAHMGHPHTGAFLAAAAGLTAGPADMAIYTARLAD